MGTTARRSSRVHEKDIISEPQAAGPALDRCMEPSQVPQERRKNMGASCILLVDMVVGK